MALLDDEPNEAVARAADVARIAETLGVARYATVARLVVARARRRARGPVDPDAVGRDMDTLERDVWLDAWWVAAEVARDFELPAWRDRAIGILASLARAAGPEDVGLVGAAARLLPRG